jgi:DNA-binding winged helix-turn-helix (wHTH) protein
MDKEQQLKRRFKLGRYEVIPNENIIFDGTVEQQVAHKAMEVLVALLRRHPDTVSRKHLIGTVWHGHSDSEKLLTHAVANLRDHFKDSIANPRYIETNAKGYRLIEVVELDPDPLKREENISHNPRFPGFKLGGAILAIAVLLWFFKTGG